MKDAVKGINMFRKVNVPILGLVQNMSLFHCPSCGGDTAVFGSNERVRAVCQDQKIDFLGDVPLHQSIADDAHDGKPTVVSEPGSERAEVFMSIAREVGGKVGL